MRWRGCFCYFGLKKLIVIRVCSSSQISWYSSLQRATSGPQIHFDGAQYGTHAHFCPYIEESVTWNMIQPITMKIGLMIFFECTGLITCCMHQRCILHQSFFVTIPAHIFVWTNCFLVTILKSKQPIVNVNRSVVWYGLMMWDIRVQN